MTWFLRSNLCLDGLCHLTGGGDDDGFGVGGDGDGGDDGVGGGVDGGGGGDVVVVVVDGGGDGGGGGDGSGGGGGSDGGGGGDVQSLLRIMVVGLGSLILIYFEVATIRAAGLLLFCSGADCGGSGIVITIILWRWR